MFGPLETQFGNGWTLYHDECVNRMLQMEENSIDCICCDPPYHLTSIVERFGSSDAAPAQVGETGAYARASKGFMGKRWDGGNVAFRVETWRAAYRLLKPGGYIFAFASSRGYHRMACAIEDAGFITHPMIGWVFGSGFPKATNLSREIDKALDATGSVERRIRPGADRNKTGVRRSPATPEAQQWSGWFYGGQARKPALEPIYVGQKPFSEKNGALNVLRWGVGGVNIDGVRVGESGGTKRSHQEAYGAEGRADQGGGQAWRSGHEIVDLGLGRWPANLIHDGSSEVLAMFPDSKAGGSISNRASPKTKGIYGEFNSENERWSGYADTGSAARFFECYPPLIYCAKASNGDRAGSKHATVKPQKLMRALVRHGCPPGGIVLDPFTGTGSTLKSAIAEGRRAIGIEADATSITDTVWRMRYT